MSQWFMLKERVAGKWQLPLLAASFALLASALFQLGRPPSQRPFPEAVQAIELLVRGQVFDEALNLGTALLQREETTARQLAPVRLAMARSRSQKARAMRVDRVEFGRLIVEDYGAAVASGETLVPDDLQRRAQAYEWQGRFALAVEEYGGALAEGVAHPLELRRHVITLTLDHLNPSPTVANTLLERYLGDIGDARLDLRLWAVNRQMELLIDRGELDAVATLLTRNHDRFAGSDLFPRFEFMEAALLYHQGHFDQAEAQLRGIRNRVDRNDSVYAMTGWLLGRTVMSDDGPQRPQEAISFFNDVLAYHAGDPYALASRVGAAEALAMLERHAEALDAYRLAVEDLGTQGSSRVVNREVLRTSLSVMAEAQRQATHFAEAVEYARLAVSLLNAGDLEASAVLLQQLAQLQTLLAGHLDQEAGPLSTESRRPVEARSKAAREALADAAATYVRLTQLDALNERRGAEASWWAAELYAKAGQRDRAAKLFRAFVAERPQHAFVPRALLRLGQLLQMSGRLPEAIAAYQDCYQRFPHTLDGARALIPLARAYLSLGPKYEDMAGKTLAIVLDQSEVFTPQAPEFADAVFLLGEAQNRHGQFERAIATFEEALSRYPDDPRAWRARYQLADSYRRSGLALKAEARDAAFAEEMERMRAESLRRIGAAQGFYRELIDAYELRDPASLDRRDRVYLRHARLYEADCYFETQAYDRAIKLYEEAAGLFKETPSALAAYVQMINCHVFLGEPNEARAALARAQVLVDSMSDRAFAASPSPEGREDWKRYLDWLGRSDLF